MSLEKEDKLELVLFDAALEVRDALRTEIADTDVTYCIGDRSVTLHGERLGWLIHALVKLDEAIEGLVKVDEA